MRDTSYPLRLAVYNKLKFVVAYAVGDENTYLNFYDEKRLASVRDTVFGIFSTQQETPTEQNDCTFIQHSSIDIEIYQKTGSEVSKDLLDNLSNQICVLLVPTPYNTTIVSSNLQFTHAQIDSIISRNISISETESVLAKIIRFSVNIVQQSN